MTAHQNNLVFQFTLHCPFKSPTFAGFYLISSSPGCLSICVTSPVVSHPASLLSIYIYMDLFFSQFATDSIKDRDRVGGDSQALAPCFPFHLYPPFSFTALFKPSRLLFAHFLCLFQSCCTNETLKDGEREVEETYSPNALCGDYVQREYKSEI